MKKLDRRSFLKIGGAGLAGLAISRFDIPYLSYLSPKNALAMGSSNAWTFGVMSDTQWARDASGFTYPGGELTCATDIIDALNTQFVGHQCKFVIQVGDLCDKESAKDAAGVTQRSLPTRAAHAQVLYDNGIGFFPVRGNHEATSAAAGEIQTLFPQTQGGGANVFGATNFDSPVLGASGNALTGLSYSFDYNNVRCVLIDQFTRFDGSNYPSGTSNNNNAVDQVPWVTTRVSTNTGTDKHTFVFSHKNLIGQNHKDVLFGSTLTSNADARDAFITACASNGVRYCLGGHDHMHHRSLVSTSDKSASVGQIICSSNSYKFYIPGVGDDGRETPVTQELFTVGYYIFTVDGPRVTVDFYSTNHGADYGDTDLHNAPPFAFFLRERFGYSLNGEQYLVEHGESYVGIESTYNGTKAKILNGTNGNTETDYLTRQLQKTVCTGWADAATAGAASHVFSLWGMMDNLSLYDGTLTGQLPDSPESLATDEFALAITYDPKKVRPSDLVSGRFVIISKDDEENWVSAVDLNTGGAATFIYGPWKATYGLGTYGVDPRTKTAWAVLNHEGDFALKLMAV